MTEKNLNQWNSRMVKGVYTLANDNVYDQLVAFLNSVEVNVSKDMPVCVIPYDEKLGLVKAEIAKRPNVSLFDDRDSIKRWEDFFAKAWAAHPMAKVKTRYGKQYRGGHIHRKFCSFDGPFERFIFCDADSLLMKPIDDVFEKLDSYDFVFDDWEHGKPDETVCLNFSFIEANSEFKEPQVRSAIHGDNFFGSKKGLFPEEELEKLAEKLIKDNEISWARNHMWWDSATLFSYMTFRSGYSQFNFTQSLDPKERTGNCAKADPFVNIDNVLYNQEGLKPVHYLHYAGYGNEPFRRLSKGEDVNVRYRDEFLHYRFLRNPDLRPKILKKPSLSTKLTRLFLKSANKMRGAFR